MTTETKKFVLWVWQLPYVGMCEKARELANIKDGDFVKITAPNGNSIIRQILKVPLSYLREVNQQAPEFRESFIKAVALPRDSARFLFTNRIEDESDFSEGLFTVEKTEETMSMP